MAQAMTYAQVRDFVRGQVGDDCVSTEGMELFMRNCLESMHNKLGREEGRKSVSITVSPSSPTAVFPAGVDKIISLIDSNNCPLERGTASCLLCVSGREHSGNPTKWEIAEGKIVFHPAPDKPTTYTAEVLSSLDCTLYTVDSAGVKNWKAVALPEGLHTAYAKCVLGMSLVDSDPARAQNWLTIADTEFSDWKSRLTTATAKGITWGKTPRMSCGCAKQCSCAGGAHSLATIKAGW
jgi:hypothetical protein